MAIPAELYALTPQQEAVSSKANYASVAPKIGFESQFKFHVPTTKITAKGVEKKFTTLHTHTFK